MAIEEVDVMQAKVVFGCRDKKCKQCKQHGAAVAINYKTEDFVEVVKRETDGKGVDFVLDVVGGR